MLLTFKTIAQYSNQYAAPSIYPGQHIIYYVYFINTNQRKAAVSVPVFPSLCHSSKLHLHRPLCTILQCRMSDTYIVYLIDS